MPPPNSRPLTSIVAEKAVLGAALRSKEAFFSVRHLLRPDAFSAPLYARVFAEMADAYDNGQNPTIQFLTAKIGERFDGAELDAVLAVLMKNAADVGSPLDHAGDLAELAACRKLKAIGEKLIEQSGAAGKLSGDIASAAEISILDAASMSAPARPQRLSDLARRVGSVTSPSEAPKLRFTTGLPSLDEIAGEILGGDMFTILGSQGDGKTALAVQIGMHIARAKPVLMFQMEMGGDQIAARELAAASGMTVAELHKGQLRMDELQQLQDAYRALDLYDFFVLDLPKVSVREMKRHAVAMLRTIGLGALIVDQLDKVRSEKNHRDRFERFTEITGDLKTLARELGVPLILLGQRTRGAQRRDESTPHVTDADSPSVERVSDTVVAVWREENWLRANRPTGKRGGEAMDEWSGKVARAKGWAKAICLKRRRGEAYGEREFKWTGSATRFEEP